MAGLLKPLALAAILVLGAAPGCSPQSQDMQTPSALADAMTGLHESTPGDPNNNFTDQRFRLNFAEDDSGSAWIYLQLNTGDDRKVYRQRVLQLMPSEGAVRQRTWTLKDPNAVLDEAGQPVDVDALTLADLEKPLLEDGCVQLWRYEAATDAQPWQWVGIVDPKTCVIQSKRRNKRIGIGSESRLSANTLRQAERGFDLDGTQLWGTPAGDFAVMNRQY